MTPSASSPAAGTGDLFGVATAPARRIAARIATLLIADGVGFVTHAVDELVLDAEGIVGDRHRGHERPADSRVPWYPRGTPIRNTRHVSLVAPAELARIAARLEVPEVRAEWLGANLVIEGLADLTRLPVGTRLVMPGGASLAVEGENAPCRHAGRAVAEGLAAQGHTVPAGFDLAFAREAVGLRGLVAWVERPGVITVGPIEARVPAQHIWTG